MLGDGLSWSLGVDEETARLAGLMCLEVRGSRR